MKRTPKDPALCRAAICYVRVVARACVLLLAISSGAVHAANDRAILFPKLQQGQTIRYEISFRAERDTRAQSAVVMAQAPPAAKTDTRTLLRLEVLGVETRGPRAAIHARTLFEPFDSDAAPAASSPQSPPNSPASTGDTWVEFTLSPEGRIDQLKGLDALQPEQQQAWQQWVSRFAVTAMLPANGVRLAQKWKSEQPEKSPAPIAGLVWVRASTYVRNEPCRPVQRTPQGDFVESNQLPDTCAVIITAARLQQKSSPKDTTPADYRVRGLRTLGTARGANSTITYISLTTGLVVRASDDASQAMDVTIAKADASNRVHYGITAKSHSEVLLITEASAQPNRP